VIGDCRQVLLNAGVKLRKYNVPLRRSLDTRDTQNEAGTLSQSIGVIDGDARTAAICRNQMGSGCI